ncbi:MAG TPA: FMN-binding protein [Phycisphaerae bacterium]|nr:FMN-binding protein [Phycisphaerae bacterium]
MKNYVREGWLVVTLAMVFGAALTGVDRFLGPIIEENQRNETYNKIPDLVPGGDKEKAKEVEIGGRNVLKIFDEKDRHLGWVLRASGRGYSDRIKVLLGTDIEVGKITGVYVLEQKETPGLGSKITSSWNRQFVGKSTSPPLVVVKRSTGRDNEIDAISGATISSKALTKIVNDAVEAFRTGLAAYKAPPEQEATEGSIIHGR